MGDPTSGEIIGEIERILWIHRRRDAPDTSYGSEKRGGVSRSGAFMRLYHVRINTPLHLGISTYIYDYFRPYACAVDCTVIFVLSSFISFVASFVFSLTRSAFRATVRN